MERNWWYSFCLSGLLRGYSVVEEDRKSELGNASLVVVEGSFVELDDSPRTIPPRAPPAKAAAALVPDGGSTLKGAGVSGRLASGGGI